jgi:putative ABC transport system ATP-binding protein
MNGLGGKPHDDTQISRCDLTSFSHVDPRRHRFEEEIIRTTDQLIEKIGLVEKRRHRPSQLSAGEQQRVAIARALANRPQLVLMDEPTGNLDQENSRTILDLVTDMMSNDGVTFVVATHNLDIVQGTSSRLFLKAGKAAADVLSNS